MEQRIDCLPLLQRLRLPEDYLAVICYTAYLEGKQYTFYIIEKKAESSLLAIPDLQGDLIKGIPRDYFQHTWLQQQIKKRSDIIAKTGNLWIMQTEKAVKFVKDLICRVSIYIKVTLVDARLYAIEGKIAPLSGTKPELDSECKICCYYTPDTSNWNPAPCEWFEQLLYNLVTHQNMLQVRKDQDAPDYIVLLEQLHILMLELQQVEAKDWFEVSLILEVYKELEEKRDPIFDAVKSGTLQLVVGALAQGSNIHARTEYYLNTPLHEAVFMGYSDIAEFLIAQGADIQAKNRWGIQPLHYAREKKDQQLLRILGEIEEHAVEPAVQEDSPYQEPYIERKRKGSEASQATYAVPLFPGKKAPQHGVCAQSPGKQQMQPDPGKRMESSTGPSLGKRAMRVYTDQEKVIRDILIHIAVVCLLIIFTTIFHLLAYLPALVVLGILTGIMALSVVRIVIKVMRRDLV